MNKKIIEQLNKIISIESNKDKPNWSKVSDALHKLQLILHKGEKNE